jgi:hypothetical protein
VITEAFEALIRNMGGGDELRLLAEIDALRRLPVIATCGDCRHVDDDDEATVCALVDGDPCGEVIDEADAPPEWCPLRGSR